MTTALAILVGLFLAALALAVRLWWLWRRDRADLHALADAYVAEQMAHVRCDMKNGLEITLLRRKLAAREAADNRRVGAVVGVDPAGPGDGRTVIVVADAPTPDPEE